MFSPFAHAAAVTEQVHVEPIDNLAKAYGLISHASAADEAGKAAGDA